MSREVAVMPEHADEARTATRRGRADVATAKRSSPRSGSRRGGARAVVALHGTLDHENAPALRRRLVRALESSPEGIDLDLGDVSFWDCSALNVLLSVRLSALRTGRTVTVGAASPVVRRVLELTGALPLFTTAAEA